MLAPSALVLALDTGSPRISVAAGRGGELPVTRCHAQAESSQHLLHSIDEVLGELGARPRDLAAVVALAGPGSFTGLRVGLATAFGLHQALGIPAVALPTLEVLLAAAPEASGERYAVVDAIRGEWFVLRGEAGKGLDASSSRPPDLLSAAALAGLAPATLVGFGVEAAFATLEPRPGGLVVCEPPPLALVALEQARHGAWSWEAGSLTRPHYWRAPAVNLPAPRPRSPVAAR